MEIHNYSMNQWTNYIPAGLYISDFKNALISVTKSTFLIYYISIIIIFIYSAFEKYNNKYNYYYTHHESLLPPAYDDVDVDVTTCCWFPLPSTTVPGCMRRRLQTMMIIKTTKMAKTTPPTTAPATIPAVEEKMTSIRDNNMLHVYVCIDLCQWVHKE